MIPPKYVARTRAQMEFCDCTLDQVCLIRRGYIGGSPKHPRTAFSLRLLRWFHTFWKYCAHRVQPFAEALDEYLDAFNPLILAQGSNQVGNFTMVSTARLHLVSFAYIFAI